LKKTTNYKRFIIRKKELSGLNTMKCFK